MKLRTKIGVAISATMTAAICMADYYDLQAAKWHKTKATLPAGRLQTIGLPSAPDNVLASVGIIPAVTDPTPAGMVRKGWTVEVVAGIAHRVPVCITQAEQDALDAEAAAADLERRNTPIVYDQPLGMPALVLQSHDAGVGVGVAASDTGELVPFTYHASPVPDAATIKARKDAATAKRAAAKKHWRNNSGQGQLQKRVETLEAIVNELLGIE